MIAEHRLVKCNNHRCGYATEDFNDPICPALELPDGIDPTTDDGRAKGKADISDPSVRLPDVTPESLPRCPQCKRTLLRPNVVWFGEDLPDRVLDNVEAYLRKDNIDLIMVIGKQIQVLESIGRVLKSFQAPDV